MTKLQINRFDKIGGSTSLNDVHKLTMMRAVASIEKLQYSLKIAQKSFV